VHATDALTDEGAFRRIAGRLGALTGWRRLAAAFAFGGLATFALPPAHAVPVLFAAFPALLWLLDGVERPRTAFAVGWFFGFGHHLLGLYWVTWALFTDIGQFWWALPLSTTGLPMGLALFTGLVALIVWALANWALPARGLARALLFAVVWTAVEWLRGHALTGFPWNLIGYSWVGTLPVLQAVSVTGIYGLGLLTVLVAALPAAFADPAEPPRRTALALLAGLALFGGIGAWGAMRLAGAPADTVPGVRLRLIQAGIEQRYKWDPAARRQVFESQLELAAQPAADPAAGPVTHVIWPETAIPYFIEHDMAGRQAVAAVTPPGGLTLTGAPRRQAGPDGQPRYYNSLLAIDAGGRVTATFDKFHLVPFGEYMPLRSWLPVGAIAGYGSEFSAGPGPVTLPLAGLPPVSPLICYEVIFPGAVVDASARPQWLLNLTNDAWYGHTAGPHQHFAISRVRAVEEGLPLVRSAQTGISGVVDAHGRVTAELGLGARGVLDAALPVGLADPTIYGRAGDWVLVVLLMICTALAGFARQRR